MLLKFIESEKFYMPIIYIVVGVIVYILIAKMITKVSRINIKHSSGIEKRKVTIVNLIKNVFKYVIAIIIIILILNVYGVDTTSIIASLGAVSVIIGLAFQDIIKDFLAGMFLIFDNAYAVGDWVEIGGFKGEIIAFGLKTTKIRAYTGEVKIIANSSFSDVVNYNLNHSKLVLGIPVSYDIDINKLEDILKGVQEKIEKINDVYGMELLGIDEFRDSSISYAVLIECRPMTHFVIKRKALGIIKEEFDNNGIVIPYQQLDIHIEK